jgi:16S rRNA (cytosine1402-N4)-methyltransferase
MTMAALELTPPSGPTHTTVMREEVVHLLAPAPGSLCLDVTAGAGGHTEAILEANPEVRVIACDRDPRALEHCALRLEQYGRRVTFWHTRFDELGERCLRSGHAQVDAVIADLGISSLQLDDPDRGLSFKSAGPLDMRMDPTSGETALELIARLNAEELAGILYHFGEERRSRRIARCIKQAEHAGELVTTLDLRRAVVRAVGPRRVGGIDPATRTFQALRVAVNHELDQLEALLELAPKLIMPGGRLVVISFHSLEDRLVKRALSGTPVWQRVSNKPILPSPAEQANNPRSRSAKLRAALRLAEPGGPG